MERDEQECRDQAISEVRSPLVAGLLMKAGSALAGAVLGAIVVLSAAGSSPSHVDPQAFGLALGGGVALGFVAGSIVGTFAGVQGASRAAGAREGVFVRCMNDRGYQFQ